MRLVINLNKGNKIIYPVHRVILISNLFAVHRTQSCKYFIGHKYNLSRSNYKLLVACCTVTHLIMALLTDNGGFNFLSPCSNVFVNNSFYFYCSKMCNGDWQFASKIEHFRKPLEINNLVLK